MLAIKENSHPGFRVSTVAPRPDFSFAISNTPTGLGDPLYDFRGGPRSSGYFRDAETGLDYAKNRYHQPGMGRFLTPDRKRRSAHQAIPGSWNRYAYALGDPIKYTDKKGSEVDCTEDCDLSDDGCDSDDPADCQDDAGGGGGDDESTDDSPLPFSQLLTTQYNLQHQKFSSDCMTFLASLGDSTVTGQTVTAQSLQSTLNSLTFVDANTSTALYSSLWQNASPEAYAQQQATYGNQTVGAQMSANNAMFATPYGGTTVYYDASGFLSNNPSQALINESLLHEVLHAMGFVHSDMSDAAGGSLSSFDASLMTKCINN
jgi:RHS repeat-associated protein